MIKELKTLEQNKLVSIKGLIIDTKEMTKKDNVTPYLQVYIGDTTGNIDFPVWDDFEENKKTLIPGLIYEVKGIFNLYQGKPQISSPSFHLLSDAKPTEFIAKYEIPQELYDYFTNTISNMEDKYKRFAISATGCMGDSKWKWDMFTAAPAAKSHHQNKIGGLFIHTVGVMKNIENMLNLYVDNPFFTSAGRVINKDRMMLKAILHDIGKVGEYEWETGIKRRNIVRDHIMMGVSYIERLNMQMNCFDEEELDNICASIMTHHGKYASYGKSEMTTAEDYMLHLADMIDSKIVGITEGGAV
jgi:23S rRNA maturation-related 3'-5' exoribonuclease YhaM